MVLSKHDVMMEEEQEMSRHELYREDGADFWEKRSA